MLSAPRQMTVTTRPGDLLAGTWERRFAICLFSVVCPYLSYMELSLKSAGADNT